MAALHAELGLIDQAKFLVLDCLPELTFQRKLVTRALVQVGR